MANPAFAQFERFLVEDVILTLGNIRCSLAWLTDADSASPEMLRAGLERLDRQIALLEDRARAACPYQAPRAADPDGPAYAEGSGMSLEEILRDALGEEAGARAPVFRSARAAADG